MHSTGLLFEDEVLYVNNQSWAQSIQKLVSQGGRRPNSPGGEITDKAALEESLKNMYSDDIVCEWHPAPKTLRGATAIISQADISEARSRAGGDIKLYEEVRNMPLSDQADIAMYVYLSTAKNLVLKGNSSGGTLVKDLQKLAADLGTIIDSKTAVNVPKMSDQHIALAKQLDFERLVFALQKRQVRYKVLSTYQALIEFVSHEGTTAYYLKNGNYLLQVGDSVMEITNLGAVVYTDPSFDDELLKLGYKIVKFTKDEARAILTLSKVLEVKRTGDSYLVSFSLNLPGTVDYPGFVVPDWTYGTDMRDLLNPIIRQKKAVLGESGWESYSVHVLALHKFFKDQLQSNMKYVKVVEEYLDTVCTVDGGQLYKKLTDLLECRREFEANMMDSLLNAFLCIDFSKKALAILTLLGCSGKCSLPYTEDDIQKALRYPSFSENAERLKSGRFSRNSDPRKFLHKQYPIVEGGPAGIMGDVTADKWERVFATLKLLLGSGFLSKFSSFLYAGVTNSDRMLGGICNAWSSEGPTKGIDNLVLLDKNVPNPTKWNLKFGDHVFTLKTPQNPRGEFVNSDLVAYMDDLDTSVDKTRFIFSDANVLSTNDEDYLEKNEFSAEGIELGFEKLTHWIVNHKRATPNGVAAAKYIFKCASKFAAGAIKLHLFRVNPDFMIDVQFKLYELAGLDSLLWKEGRGHNPEYYFYFFPPVEGRLIYPCSHWIMPVLCLASAVSEMTRHISFYCPNKVEGHNTISPDGILGHSSSFPIIFPSSNVRSYEKFEVGGKVYVGIKNIRVGTQPLVAGIANDVSKPVINLDAFRVSKPPAPKEETREFSMEPPSTAPRVIKPLRKQVVEKEEPAVESNMPPLLPSVVSISSKSRPPSRFIDVVKQKEGEIPDPSVEDIDDDEKKREERKFAAFDI